VWDAITFASTVSDVFDFEGSMNERIEPFFRSFGARQQLLLNVSRMSWRMSAITAIKSLFQKGRRAQK
jgi:ribosome biogenesis GTPase A